MSKLLFINLSKLSTFSNFLISGYVVNSSGHTGCFLDFSGNPMTRVQKGYRVPGPALWLPLTSVKNSTKLLEGMVFSKLLDGEIIYLKKRTSKVTIQTHIKDALLKGYIDHEKIVQSPTFKAWHKLLKDQVKIILPDRSEFKKEAEYRESLDYILNALGMSNRDNRLGVELLRKAVDEAFDRYVIDNVYES